jgi:acetyltransferase-like isoleucine patch superfamily enzyme
MFKVAITSRSGATENRATQRQSGPDAPRSRFVGLIKTSLKGIGIALGMVISVLPALTCGIERAIGQREAFFLFWGQAFALMPGLPGKYIRKCFYFLTLSRCSLSCDIGFLTFVHDRRTHIGHGVYIGTAVGIGWGNLGDGCLIASRVSILSGGSQHQFGPDGRLTPFDRTGAKQIHIGPDAWIGEGAIVMADVEGHCIVGAGSIVTRPVASGCVVVGNPARVVRRVADDESAVSGDRGGSPRRS